MYEKIIEEIKSNLGNNKELNKQYLSSQMEVYKDHPNNKEIIREISRMMWDCLSDDEKEEYMTVPENENPILDILNDIYFDIDNGNYEVPLKKLDRFMESFRPIFEDDEVFEYHYFTNLLEELTFRKFIGLKKEMKYIPDNQPLLDVYYVYGFLLLETKQYEKAERYLKKAIRINPVSSRIILELAEILKIHTYTYNEFFLRTSEALKYAYYPHDLARCYRNLGYYYVEENEIRTALALFQHSLEYDLSPLTYSEIKHIQSRNEGLELTLEESVEIIKSKNIQLGPNPFILETLDGLIDEYMENMLYPQTLYFLEIKYNLKPDEETLRQIQNMQEKINY